ncbi:hypothetical protein Tco_0287271 [Tanacetum coccineum]
MDAPTILVSVDSSKGNFRDAIDIGLDVDHPVPVPADAFPAVTIVTILASLGEAIRGIHEYLQGVPMEEEMSTLSFKMGMAEAENASLRGKIRTMEAIERVTRSQERRTRREIERQLASVQEITPKKKTTRASPATTTTTTPITNAQLKALIDQGIADALAAHDADRSMNGDDNHNSGTGVRRNERANRECTYPDFMKCQPLNFKCIEGVVELTQWFEKMETVFHISNCSVENQIKFSTCTLLRSALTW